MDPAAHTSAERPPSASPAEIDGLGGEAGFSMVEILVAAVVLLVGVLGVAALLTGAMSATAAGNQRVGATNLARELGETARGLDYDTLTPALFVTSLQAKGLGAGTPWTIVRRGVTYTITAGACTFDSPADEFALTPPAYVCPSQPTGPTGDSNGDDFRRVTFQIAWSDRGTQRSMTQSHLIVNPSGGLGPLIKSITPLTQTITAGTSALVTFSTSPAATVRWHADDGRSAGNALLSLTVAGSWTVNWPLGVPGSEGAVSDGSFQIIAQAYDDRGIAGDAKLATVVLNRSAPLAPPSLAGGRDTRLNDWVDLSWGLNAERDVVGYRVYRTGPDLLVGNGNDVLVCPGGSASMLANTTSSCTDTAPVGIATIYYVVAVDRDSAGDLRQGGASVVNIALPSLLRPAKPSGPLVATIVDDATKLTWNAPLIGSPIFYRIYRDGTALADRHDRTSGATTTWSDGRGSSGHQYYVTAVDSTYNESDPIGPVS